MRIRYERVLSAREARGLFYATVGTDGRSAKEQRENKGSVRGARHEREVLTLWYPCKKDPRNKTPIRPRPID